MALLLAGAVDDEAHHILWIDTAGHVHLDPVSGSESPRAWETVNHRRLLLRKETFAAGNGYCGRAAACDLDYVEQTLSGLRSHYASGAEGYLDA
jgi:hypothetical protein